jgi:hypothetical protein
MGKGPERTGPPNLAEYEMKSSQAVRRFTAIGVGATAALAMMMTPSVAHATPGNGNGDSNAGDVWVDTVGQPAGPGHEMDPHLPCADINLWGAKLADPSGTYTIDSWPPSGSQEQVYSSSWQYNRAQGGTQVISVINHSRLISAAVAAGATPQAKQGYHFKLQFVQDPQKHKTFWINCPAPTPLPTATAQPTPVPTPTPTASLAPTATALPTEVPSTPTPTPAGGVGGATPTPSPEAGGVQGVSVTPTPAPASGTAGAANSGIFGAVQGIATSPVTGAALPIGAALLLAGSGAAAMAAARKRRRR